MEEIKKWIILGGKYDLELSEEELSEKTILYMAEVQQNEFGGFFAEIESKTKIGFGLIKKTPGTYYIRLLPK